MNQATSYAIQIPASQCQRAPYTPELTLSAEAVEAEHQSLNTFGYFTETIHLRALDQGRYEVISGWHLVCLFKHLKPQAGALMTAQVHSDSDAQAIHRGLRELSERHNCHRLHIARALAASKHHYGWNDQLLANAMGKGYSRASINHHLRLNKLIPEAQQRYLAGHFQHSVAKFLSAKSSAEQSVILEQHQHQSQIRIHQLQPQSPKSSTAAPQPAQNAKTPKTRDQLRLEADLSEHLGAPIDIEDNQRLRAQFFSINELANIAERLSAIAAQQGDFQGQIDIRFPNADGLNQLIDNLYPEEEF